MKNPIHRQTLVFLVEAIAPDMGMMTSHATSSPSREEAKEFVSVRAVVVMFFFVYTPKKLIDETPFQRGDFQVQNVSFRGSNISS